ncbi:MAG: M48 family metalloprotease [Phycisphaerales bacterium]|nr:M48 family metalloprotease [Planctomycetota bacterium]
MATGLIILIFMLDALTPALAHARDAQPFVYAGWMAGVVAAAALVLTICRIRLERTGRIRHLLLAERTLSLSRSAVVGVHAYGMIELGWSLTAARLSNGLPVVRELVTALPPILAFVLIYFAYTPIQRRVRQSLLWRHLHQGFPIAADRSLFQLLLEHIRHSILLALVPLLMLTVWRHAGDYVLSFHSWKSASTLEWAKTILQILGIFTILATSPWMLRFVWDTVPLQGGELRRAVEDVFRRNQVSTREVLVWQTSSGTLNGALMGVLPRARYVLFTDALLQILPTRQVEAVAAHEAGHGRLHHLPWLIGSTIAAAFAGGILYSFGAAWIIDPESWSGSALAIAASGGAALLTLGFVSRRFELQADAFAAKDLSRFPAPLPSPSSAEPGEVVLPALPAPPSSVITEESVQAMIEALQTVADLNGLPPRRFTWRHGTVVGRQRHLQSIIGLPLDRLPIDRTVRILKATILGAAVLGAGLICVSILLPGSDDKVTHAPERAGKEARRFDPGRGSDPAPRSSHAR